MKTLRYIVSASIMFVLLVGAQYAVAANLLFSDGFEDGTFDAWGENHGSIISTDAARTGTYGLEYCYSCFGGGGNTLVGFSPRKRVFLSFYQYFVPGFNFAWAPGRHGFRIKSNLGTNGGQLDTILTSDMGVTLFSNCSGGACEKENPFGYIDTNRVGGVWYHVEVDAKWNTQGQSDGFLKVYMDGVLIKDVTNAVFSYGDEYWKELWITSNDDNCSGGPSSCTYYIDDVQVWDAGPGNITNNEPPADGDTIPPIISSISSSNLSESNATITATTNEPADYQVEYGLTTSYGESTSVNSSMGTNHTVMLSGLSPNTTYHYRVRSTDMAGNLAISEDMTFSTNTTTTNSYDECRNWQINHPEWIWCDDFESGGLSIGQGQYFEYNNNNGEFKPVLGVGLNNSYGARARWQAGEVNAGDLKVVFGRNPIGDRGIRSSENFKNLYYRFYVRTQAGWFGDPMKLSRATVFAGSDWSQAMIAHNWSGNNGVLQIDPASCVDGASNVVCSGYNDFTNLQWLGKKNGQTQIYSTDNADTWYCVESHVKLNDTGQNNGIQEFWVDGYLEARSANLNFVNSYSDYGINAVFLENYWNNGSPKEQERYLDNFVISTQPIGCDTASGLAPPSPPSNIR